MRNKNIIYVVFTILGGIIFQACNKCACDAIGCICPEISIQIEANLDNQEPGSFNGEELNEFYLVRTNLNYGLIDSIKIDFGNVAGNIDYNKSYTINERKFPSFTSFKDYNFILINHETGYSDTISNLVYEEATVTKFCGQCSNCEGQKITCQRFDNFKFDFNSGTQTENSVRLLN